VSKRRSTKGGVIDKFALRRKTPNHPGTEAETPTVRKRPAAASIAKRVKIARQSVGVAAEFTKGNAPIGFGAENYVTRQAHRYPRGEKREIDSSESCRLQNGSRL